MMSLFSSLCTQPVPPRKLEAVVSSKVVGKTWVRDPGILHKMKFI